MAADDWLTDTRPVRRVSVFRDVAVDWESWPATVPAVAQVLREGLDLPAGVTFLVGENGSGKSTLLEGVAMAYGLPPEGGSNNGGGATRAAESPLHEWLRLEHSPSAPRWGFFLRAETMHGYYTWREREEIGGGAALHAMSHGESFNALLSSSLNNPQYVTGLACLDEPEAALSFSSVLRWLVELDDMAKRGTQVLCATHSPMLAALPGAHILELGEWGIRESSWEDLELVRNWRLFLDAPGRYFRHLL